MSVHPCSRDFARALTNPVDYDGPPVCMPATLLPLPTTKFTTRCVAYWGTGASSGVGFLAIAPGSTWASDSGSVVITDQTYPGGWASPMASSGTGVSHRDMISPYALADAGGMAARLVSIGMKTSCYTSGLDRGGILLNYTHPDRFSCVDVSKPPKDYDSQLSAALQTFAADAGVPAYGLSGGPRYPSDLELVVPSGLAATDFWMFVACRSTAAQSLKTEIVAHWEIIQPTGGAFRTTSHSDPGPSGSAVGAVASKLYDNKGNRPINRAFIAEMDAEVRKAWNHYGPSESSVRSMVRTAVNALGLGARLYSGDYVGAAASAASLASEGSKNNKKGQGRRVHATPQRK